jgi:glutamate-1-semialdehyde 2,1-aminomutase
MARVGPRSVEAFARISKTLAQGVGSSPRAHDSPFVLSHGKGSRVQDLDGREYIDYLLGFGPLILGHAPDVLVSAIVEQADKGLLFAAGCELEYLAAEEVVRLVPCAEKVRFFCSGSEAVHDALRVARATTGRDRIIRFEGHFHGTVADIYVSSYPGRPYGPDAAPSPKRDVIGQPPSVLEDIIVLPFNDLGVVEATLRERASEVAAVILEPYPWNNGSMPPREGYLSGLRDLTRKHGVLLIFDEVVTGFRLALGGAQEFFGVVPDLAVLAKALGCGLPVSAIAGTQAAMQVVDDGTLPLLGTYNTNPLVLAGVVAALRELARDDGAAIKHMHAIGDQLRVGLDEAFREMDAPFVTGGCGPMFTVFGSTEPPTCYRERLRTDLAAVRRFRDSMRDRGVWFQIDGKLFTSAAHTETDVEQTLAAAREVLSLQGDFAVVQ